MIIYITILVFKIIENMLSTLRIILIADKKKKIGAILNGIIALLWIMVTGIVIIDIKKDIFKIIFFCIGSMAGSYFGSTVEEKLSKHNKKVV